jgi:hypothetical protein
MKLKQRSFKNDEFQAKSQLQPGVEIYGFLHGLFGRDSYGVKVIMEVKDDHIIAKEDSITICSRTIDGTTYKWSEIIEDSNRWLEKELEEQENE